MFDDFDGSIAYLERLVATPVHNEPGAGLLRARLMLSRLGEPHERFITLHVTGSNGKGSTTTMCAAMLRAAGYRTGTFTSPHLEDYTERIAVDGQPISHGDWTRLLRTLYPLVEEMAHGSIPGYTLGRPALLQVLWPLAALYFVEQAVDVAVVEVGMGGRYDSTRANNARVAIITNVSLEHTQHLGASIAEIAHHKAGVTPAGGILVTAAGDEAALAVMRAECALQKATLWQVTPPAAAGEISVTDNAGGDIDADGSTEGEIGADGSAGSLDIATPRRVLQGLTLGLHGHFQRANAACALGAMDALVDLGLAAIPDLAARQGLAQAHIAGRLERVDDDPITLLDGAHNPAAAGALAAALADIFPVQKVVLLLGILGDKDLAAMVAALAPAARSIVVTEPPWPGRMGRGGDVAAQARRYCDDVTLEADVAAAYALARRRARQGGAPLVIAGSLILVGAVQSLVRLRS